jgi:transketolase
MSEDSFREFTMQIRQIILQQSRKAHVGHIGSSLSTADILSVLYARVLKIKSIDDPDRDRFILSKGHSALALYAALHLKGWLSRDLLETYCQDHTLLGVHPERDLPGVDFGTGSLGMGMSYAAGAALAARLQGSSRRVFALVSDAECNEGIIWEAAMFAAHHSLSNLYVIIDLNGQQALGYTKDVLNLAPLSKKWQAFGWDTHEVNGHDGEEMISAIRACAENPGRPHAIIARTTFGKGVSFMENQIKWHYWPLDEEGYNLAIEEIRNEKSIHPITDPDRQG